jgi:hypothetical protein
MGKYDKIFNSNKALEETLSSQEAVAAVGVVTAAADSSLEEVDADLLIDTLWGLEVFDEYSDDELFEIIDKLIAIAEEEGLGPLFNSAKKSLSGEMVLDAFASGVSVLVDEEEIRIPKGKMNLLKKLQEALAIQDDDAQEVIDEVLEAFEEAEIEDEEFDDDDEIGFEEETSPQMYESPSGNFTVAIPVDSQQGGRVQHREGLVSFSDDVGTWLRIDYSPLSSQQAEQMESVGQEEYLRSWLLNEYVPREIVSSIPDAQVKHKEYMEDVLDGAFFVLTDLPEGSTISKTGNNGTANRLDALRGLLGFIYGDFLYIVSNQRSFFEGETPGSIDDEAERIKQNILNFVDTIEFT